MSVLRKAASDAERPPKALTGEGKGSTSKSVLELERVINAMKKVIGMPRGCAECCVCIVVHIIRATQ